VRIVANVRRKRVHVLRKLYPSTIVADSAMNYHGSFGFAK
jgi:hypothetical protein